MLNEISITDLMSDIMWHLPIRRSNMSNGRRKMKKCLGKAGIHLIRGARGGCRNYASNYANSPDESYVE